MEWQISVSSQVHVERQRRFPDLIAFCIRCEKRTVRRGRQGDAYGVEVITAKSCKSPYLVRRIGRGTERNLCYIKFASQGGRSIIKQYYTITLISKQHTKHNRCWMCPVPRPLLPRWQNLRPWVDTDPRSWRSNPSVTAAVWHRLFC